MTTPSDPPRRFPAPWRTERTPSGYKVTDAHGVAVCYVNGDDRPKGAADRSLTVDEARRIAAGIVKLPELLGKTATAGAVAPPPLATT